MLRLFHKETGVRIIIDSANSAGIVGVSPATTIALLPGFNYSLKVATTSVPAMVTILDDRGVRVYGPETLNVNSIKSMATVSFPAENQNEFESFRLMVSISPLKKRTVVRRAGAVAPGSSARRYVSTPDFSEPLKETEWIPQNANVLLPFNFVKSIQESEI